MRQVHCHGAETERYLMREAELWYLVAMVPKQLQPPQFFTTLPLQVQEARPCQETQLVQLAIFFRWKGLPLFLRLLFMVQKQPFSITSRQSLPQELNGSLPSWQPEGWSSGIQGQSHWIMTDSWVTPQLASL